MDHIKYISNSSLALTNGLTIPLSRRYEKEIRTRFSKHILTPHIRFQPTTCLSVKKGIQMQFNITSTELHSTVSE